MSTKSLSEKISPIGADGYVTAEEVLELRRSVFADGIVSTHELDVLFALGERAPDGDREWLQFFAEAAADFYLREELPHGYLTDEEYETLKSRVTRDGEAASHLEIALLLRLLEEAVQTPQEMSTFVASQLKRSICEKSAGASVEADDIKRMSRLIFAAGGDANVAVTREEAEFLFDIADAVAAAQNDPQWNDFFKKAVANHLMAHIGYQPLSRRDALAHYTPDPNDGGPIERAYFEDENLFERMKHDVHEMFQNIFTPKAAHRERVERRYRQRNEARADGAVAAEEITTEETDWIVDRIGRDGVFHSVEKDLIEHLRSLDAELPPRLQDLVSKAA